LAESKKFKDKMITLICNENIEELSKVLDRDYVSRIIAIDRTKFKSNPFYRFRKLTVLKSQTSEYLINAHHSRGFYCSDWVCKLIDAKHKVAPSGDFSNISVDKKNISDGLYSSLIDLKSNCIFEFEKNLDFFSQILNEKIELTKPKITIKRGLGRPIDLLVSIGASAKERTYSVDKVIRVLEIILSKNSIVVGIVAHKLSRSDQKKISVFCMQHRVKSYVDNLNLSELVTVISNARIVLSSDTSIQHIAVALDVPEVIVLSNGNYYGRFCPYPKEMHVGYSVLLHPKFDKSENNISQKASSLQVEEISEKLVLNELTKALNRCK
jgi:ADP-heptose:LPS heptosyltransferase